MRAVVIFTLMAFACSEKITPVQKVIELMNNMVEKGKKEKQDEAVQFASFKGFCDNTVAAKQKSIAEASEMIESLTADIEKYEAEAATLAKEITSLEADISTWEGDSNAAVKVREIEHTDYVATHKDYSESISALEMAVATLKKTSGDVAQAAAALMQVASGKLFPAESRKVINAFLTMGSDEKHALKMSAPEANAYEFQSQGVVDMLEKLAGKFEDERSALEEEETNAVQSFDMLKADLTNQLDAANSANSEKKQAKAKALQGAADSKGALQDTVTTRDDDSKYTADLQPHASRSPPTLRIARFSALRRLKLSKRPLRSLLVAQCPALVRSTSLNWFSSRQHPSLSFGQMGRHQIRRN